MSDILQAKQLLQNLPETEFMTPALFMGHGSPMNAIEDNPFTQGWKNMVKDIPKPKAIICISAHWETRGTKVTAMQNPRMIYDMYGFPQPLYDVQYNAPGDPELAKEIVTAITQPTIEEDHKWGFDHGTWSVLTHAFPDADIPCIQLSLDRTRDLNYHYALAQQLVQFRKKGVLIVGSGNIVHNLSVIMRNGNQPTDWATEFDTKVVELINDRNHTPLIHYNTLGSAAEISVNSAEHYIPMLYILALQQKNEHIVYENHQYHDTLMGIGMRSFKVQSQA